jgi:predicted GH43/DUF377 family glycosyl hydrolase
MRLLVVAVVAVGLVSAMASPCAPSPASRYTVTAGNVSPSPVLAWASGSSTFQQAFNPAWVVGSSGTGGAAGLLVRSQNCTATVGGPCVFCSGNGSMASVINFARVVHDDVDISVPTFDPINSSTVVFQPASADDEFGTEDPRVAFDVSSGTYYMFYTAYGPGSGGDSSVFLNLATTTNPTTSSGWTRHGRVFPSQVCGARACMFPSQVFVLATARAS